MILANLLSAVFDASVDEALRDVCLELEKPYQLKFLEIATDEDDVHTVPMYTVTKLTTRIKSLTAREMFRECPHVNKQL